MTRKHFRLFADMVKTEKENGADPATLSNIAEKLADIFTEENARFDRSKFLEACGIPNGEWAI